MGGRVTRDLANSVVVITGASGGIGRAAARRFAAQGARLALAARREEPLRVVAEECGRLGHTTPGARFAPSRRFSTPRRSPGESYAAPEPRSARSPTATPPGRSRHSTPSSLRCTTGCCRPRSRPAPSATSPRRRPPGAVLDAVAADYAVHGGWNHRGRRELAGAFLATARGIVRGAIAGHQRTSRGERRRDRIAVGVPKVTRDPLRRSSQRTPQRGPMGAPANKLMS